MNAMGSEYELKKNGNCPICKTRNRVDEPEGPRYKGITTLICADKYVTICRGCRRKVYDKK